MRAFVEWTLCIFSDSHRPVQWYGIRMIFQGIWSKKSSVRGIHIFTAEGQVYSGCENQGVARASSTSVPKATKWTNKSPQRHLLNVSVYQEVENHKWEKLLPTWCLRCQMRPNGNKNVIPFLGLPDKMWTVEIQILHGTYF